MIEELSAGVMRYFMCESELSGVVSMPTEALQKGDWVRTHRGHEGTIILVSRMTAFVDIPDHEELRAHAYLLSDLTKIDLPSESPKQ